MNFKGFKCKHCEKTFMSRQKLYSHAIKHHGIATSKRKKFYIPKTELIEPDKSGMYKCEKCNYKSEKKAQGTDSRGIYI